MNKRLFFLLLLSQVSCAVNPLKAILVSSLFALSPGATMIQLNSWKMKKKNPFSRFDYCHRCGFGKKCLNLPFVLPRGGTDITALKYRPDAWESELAVYVYSLELKSQGYTT